MERRSEGGRRWREGVKGEEMERRSEGGRDVEEE